MIVSTDRRPEFALELLIGAHQQRQWPGGKLVIDANQRAIHLPTASLMREHANENVLA